MHSSLEKRERHNEAGQSLVEMAIIVPLMLFIFLGLVEVGWALRGYLLILSTSRETARVITKGTIVDLMALQGGADLTWAVKQGSLMMARSSFTYTGSEPTGGFAIHYIGVDTGYPCADQNPCVLACNQINNWFDEDDLIWPLEMPGVDYQPQSDYYGLQVPDRIDWNLLLAELKQKNNIQNCDLQKKFGDRYTPSVNNAVIVEVYFRQDQLLGFPFLSNSFTDPISLYAKTVMRFSEKTRP